MVTANLGMNCNSSDFKANYITDLAELKSRGFTKIRLYIATYTDSSALRTSWKNVGIYARSQGFYVIYGNTAGGNTLTSASWSTYAAAIIAEATDCQASGACDEFQIGNEEESHHDGSLSNTDIYNNMVTLASSVKAIFSGKVSYSFSAGNPGVWNTNAATIVANADFDYVGANIYGGFTHRNTFQSNFTTHVTNFGAKAFCSEFGVDSTWGNVPTDQELQTVELANRMPSVIAANIPAYFYNWRSNDDSFGVKLHDGTYRVMYCGLLGGRRFLTV